jgi:polyisoprenoid-binding protein YceI
MRCALGFLALIGLALAGCEGKPQSAPANSSTTTTNVDDAGADTTTTDSTDGANAESAADPAAAEGTTVELSPQNTTIKFVGTHAPPKAKEPRTGTFEKFSGTAVVDNAKQQIKSLSVDIDTTSLKTDIEKLTNHLKNPDFLDVEQYPTAKFESTKIAYGERGAHTVTGSLTLHGQTKEITFPAKVTPSNYGLMFNASFEIDRMDFGVGDSPAGQGTERPVTLTVTIGKQGAN